MMMGSKQFKIFCLRNHFHEQCEVIQEVLSWNESPLAQLLSTTIYIYFMEN